MTLHDHSIEDVITRQEAFEQLVKERLQYAVRIAFISVLEEEVTAFIGAKPYERSQHRRDQRNGHYSRHLDTTVGEIADVLVPRTRGGYHTQLFERYHRRRDELDGAMQDMFIKGVSMAQVGEVIETLTGSHPSASTVSRVFHTLQEEYEQWKARPAGSALCLRFCRWDLLHRDLPERRLQGAHLGGGGHCSHRRARRAGLSRWGPGESAGVGGSHGGSQSTGSQGDRALDQ